MSESICRKLYEKPSLEELRSVLHQNGRKIGVNWVFQCPICLDESHDNLIFEKNGNYIKCFSCSDNQGGKWVLTEIMRKRGEKKREEEELKRISIMKIFESKEKQEEYWQKQIECSHYLQNNDELLNLLYKKRGIDKQTVIDCGIGFDKNKQEWVLPLFSLSYNEKIMGFEYRRKNFDLYPVWNEGDKQSKVRREKGFVSDICLVWGLNSSETLYIMEGFFDSYCIRQYLRNRGIISGYTIYSCSNGVNSLLNALNGIDFSKFKKIKMILDADKAGTETTEKIIEKYPFIKDSRKFLFDSNNKDFNEWYLTKKQ